jgi:hypothetical protein
MGSNGSGGLTEGTPGGRMIVESGVARAASATPGASPGTIQVAQQSPNFLNQIGEFPPPAPQNLQDTAGRRVRLRAKPGATSTIYGSGLASILNSTNGMVFPYQPTITYQQEVTYQNIEMVHTNQDFLAYTRTPALKIQVDGEFSVQNQSEGRYALACIHFLRMVSKMWFGGSSLESRSKQGTPPPVLLFDAYGQYMFNQLPVVVTQFSVSLPKDVDYVPVKIGSAGTTAQAAPLASDIYSTMSMINSNNVSEDTSVGYAWLPALFTIQVQLTVQNTPQRLRAFDMARFRDGWLLKGGGWA